MTTQKYNFTCFDGIERSMTVGEIKKQIFPKRSYQWIKDGLADGARNVVDMVNTSQQRLERSRQTSIKNSSKSFFGRKVPV